jgi:GNAT superfamily N-acetyltransferase
VTEPADIAEAGAHDVAPLRDLYVAAWTATYGPTLGRAVLAAMLDDLDRSAMRCMLPGTGERACVARVAGRIVGSAIVAQRGSASYLWGMYVHPARQRHGLGSAMLRHAAGWLRPDSPLEARVLPTSPWALAFYARHGFRQTGQELLEVAPGHHVPALILTVRCDMLLAHEAGVAPPPRPA